MVDEPLQEPRPDPPDMLWHYTSLENLALILRNRTIRLMPLTGMDDPLENQTRDVSNLGRFFFVSCWTDDKRESIPMWNMYASLDRGVRIGLPPMPFVRYESTPETVSKATGMPLDHISIEKGLTTFMPIEDLASGLLSPAYIGGRDVLRKVDYTDDRDRLFPKVIDTSGRGLTLSFECVGVCKSTYWEFQHEWRYIMSIVPYRYFGSLETSEARFNDMVLKMAAGVLAPPCPYYELHIDPGALRKIEVTPSPKMSAGNKVLLEALLREQGLGGSLKASSLKGML